MEDWAFPVWDGFRDAEALEGLKTRGETICRFIDRQVENLCQEVVFLRIGGHESIPCVSTPLFVSEVCARLLELHPEAPFSAAFFDVSARKRVFSLRSHQGGFDVAQLAKNYGGGGHQAASGFSIELSRPLDEELA
jgi:hypothetical protein